VGTDAFSPEHLVPLVEQDDADVGPEAFTVKHNQTPIFKVEIIIALALVIATPRITRQEQ
jgi:hypothetical protein